MKRFYLFVVMLLTATQFAFAAVNLNTATQAELETVKGIGPVKSKMIIDDRAKNGPFKSIEDLDRVKGFGMKSVDKLRGQLSVTGATSISPTATAAKPAAKPTAPTKATSAPATMPAPTPETKKLSKKEAKAAAKAAQSATPSTPATVTAPAPANKTLSKKEAKAAAKAANTHTPAATH